jgi:kynureninase
VTPVRSAGEAAAADEADVLAPYRDRFVLHDDPVAYLDGNSLGRPPRSTLERVARVLEEEWGRDLIRSWDARWSDLPVEVGDRLGAAVLGAGAGQTVIADSTTVNLFKALHAGAGLRPGRDELVIDEANFPTDRFLVEAVAAARGMGVRWIPAGPAGGVTADELGAVVGPRTAVVVLSHVDYRSGYLADVGQLTAVVHDAGGVVLWDLCHSAGVVPIDLDGDGVDLAVGCTYKYLNAGPGAPAWLYVAARHLAGADNPVPGWFGAADVFAMAATYEPATDARRMLSGTPSVTGIVAVDEGVKLVAEAGVERIRAKSRELTAMVVAYADAHLRPFGAEMASPRDPERRGGHVVIRHPAAAAVTAAMTARGAVPDFRHPDLIRLGLSPLTTSYTECWRALEILREALGAG